jgi:phosphate transport system substrate-binding protein
VILEHYLDCEDKNVKQTRFLTGAVALLAAISIGQAGCTNAPSTTGTGQSPAQDSQGKVTLNGSGASFPAPLYTRWFADFNRQNPTTQVNYQSTGSGAGVQQFIAGTVDFGASDVGMKAEEMGKVPTNKGVVLLPMTAGGVVLGFNVPGVKELKLSRQVLADIFLGKIKTWNDPAIAKDNPGVTLPSLPISVVRRSDGSGTTAVFTAHLAAISPAWKAGPGVGKSVQWPVGIGAKGNEGITALIRQTRGAIGYVEYSFARQNKIPTALLQNKAGKFVPYNAQTATAALSEIKLDANLQGREPDPNGAEAYPIVSFTWIMAYRDYPDDNKAKALREVLTSSLTQGQTVADSLGYIPLPASVVTKAKELVAKIK